MVSITDFPSVVQSEIQQKGLAGSPHGLASAQLRENKYTLIGYMKPSLTKANWSRKAINSVVSHLLALDPDARYAHAKYLSTRKAPL